MLINISQKKCGKKILFGEIDWGLGMKMGLGLGLKKGNDCIEDLKINQDFYAICYIHTLHVF